MILEPVQSLCDEISRYLETNGDLVAADIQRYQSQLRVYEALKSLYSNPAVCSTDVPQGAHDLFAQLQALGSPPPTVSTQLLDGLSDDAEPNSTGLDNFESFLKEATSSLGSDPSLTEEDLKVLKELTDDPSKLNGMFSKLAESLQGGSAGSEADQCKTM